MTRKIMATLTSNLSLSPQYNVVKNYPTHGSVVEEIQGLIKVHKDGYVERPQIVPCVTASTLSPELNVTSRDMVIDNVTNIWVRFYVPICQHKLPLLVYFHGGGFCVGSAAWSCYHDFLAKLSAKVGCVIMSVNYRLAPENPLPAPYDDGLKALMWVKQQLLYQQKTSEWWTSKCNFSCVFLGGDSAGANIAYHVSTRLCACDAATLRPLTLKGLILIQPFFGGEVRTGSEKCMAKSQGSALNLAASDTYWRLALPCGANRDHAWCNPLVKRSMKFEGLNLKLKILVCISEMDILKDRNLEFCDALVKAGKNVEYGVFSGVGHAFQILSKSQVAKSRTKEMMARVKSFMDLS